MLAAFAVSNRALRGQFCTAVHPRHVRAARSAEYIRTTVHGAVAQLARAPALQAGCQGFESLQLHHFYILE